MDNLPEQQANDSQYAEKGALFSKKTIVKFALIASGILGFIIVLIASISFFANIFDRPPVIIDDTEDPPTLDIAEITDEAKFAYIKNGKSAWAVDVTGENKIRLTEIPLSSENQIISLAWKNPETLGYSNCTNKGACQIYELNIKDSASNPIIDADFVPTFDWDLSGNYIAYIENTARETKLHLKTGTVDTILEAYGYKDDETNTKSQVFFSKDGLYVIYSSLRSDLPVDSSGRVQTDKEPTVYPVVYVFQVNGAPVHEIRNASDPFLLADGQLGYRKTNDTIVYRTIGQAEETLITRFTGFNPEISFDNNNIAYWRNEPELNSVILGVYDLNLDIHRNILRGVVLPTWISDAEIVGIQADSCLGDSCLLYQFKTASMVIVDVANGTVTSVDQGRTLSKAVRMPKEFLENVENAN